MKRIIFLLMLISNFIVYSQQSLDTLRLGVQYRDPTYYYECWIDEHYPAFAVEFTSFVNSEPQSSAVLFNVDAPLKVVGVACALELKSLVPDQPDDTLAEYFQVYEVDKTDSSFRKVAEARWDTFVPTTCLEMIQTENQRNYYDYACVPIYEAYFDSVITVYDSFYLAYTSYNNGQWLQPNMFGELVYRGKPTKVINYWFSIQQPIIDSSTLSCASNYKVKFLPVEGDYYEYKYWRNELVDTTVWYTSANIAYYPIFPIFDTTGNHVDTCADVSNFAVVGTDSVSALLSWDSTSRSIGWELAYGPQGTAPEDATVLEMSSTVHRLSGLDSGAWYVAYVRAKCGEEEYSNWSSGVEFYIAGDTTSRELSIHTSLLEQYTYLMPNPAHDVVSVFSSFSMNRLEVYSMNGVLMERMDCEGLSTQLTVSGYPRGAYIVKVYTPKGVATKKLVVK